MTAYSVQTRTTLGQLCSALMGLPITAGCDTAWNRTRVFTNVSSTQMQCLRPVCHSGASQAQVGLGALLHSRFQVSRDVHP